MQFFVCEETYFESNNTITVGAIRAKFSAIFFSPLLASFRRPSFFRHDNAHRAYTYKTQCSEHVAR